MRNLIGWVWVAIVSITRPTRAESIYHSTPQDVAGASRSGLSAAQGTTGGSGDFDGS